MSKLKNNKILLY